MPRVSPSLLLSLLAIAFGASVASPAVSQAESPTPAAVRKEGPVTRRATGTFVLQHTGTMTRGAPSLAVTVVPDSGTGKLTGLSGTMAIRIEDGKHFYDFEYSIAHA